MNRYDMQENDGMDKTPDGIWVRYDDLAEYLKPLMHAIGEPGICRGCGASIFWVVHRNGKRAPYTPQGLNHFVDCPKANRFKKGTPGNGKAEE